jgi:hypothetical protein
MLFPGQWLDGLPITTSAGPRHLTEEDIKRLVLCTTFLQHYNYSPDKHGLQPFNSHARLSRHAAQGRIRGNLQLFSENRTLWAISLLGLFYGAIHATSWNGHFPNAIEQTIWRIASCIVMGGGLFVCFLDYLLRHCTQTFLWPLGKGHHLEGRTKCQKLIATFLLVVINITAVMCTLSRSFFVVEAFISIRSLPAGAYETVDWTNLLPHVG